MNRQIHQELPELAEMRVTRWLLWSAVITFLGFYLMLSYHNRLTGDDLYLLKNLIKEGWWDAALNFDFNRRLSSHLLFNLWYSIDTDLTSLHSKLFVFQILLMVALIASMYALLKKLYFHVRWKLSNKDAWLMACLTISALFFFTFQLNEVWFWNISTVIHLVPVIFLFTGASILLKKKKKILDYIGLFFCFLFIGGASETMALTTLSLLGLAGAGLLFSERRIIYQRYLPGLSIASIGVLILFMNNILGHGSEERLSLESMQEGSPYATTLIGFIKVFLQPKMVVFGLFMFLFYLLGKSLKNQGCKIELSGKRKLGSILVIVIAGISTFLPLIVVFDSLGPERAWTPFAYCLGLILLFYALYLGNKKRGPFKWGIPVFSIGLITCFLWYGYRQYPMVSEYSDQYDTRIEYLNSFKGKGIKNCLPVWNLPDPGMLVDTQLEEIPDGFHTQNLSKCLELDYELCPDGSFSGDFALAK